MDTTNKALNMRVWGKNRMARTNKMWIDKVREYRVTKYMGRDDIS